MAKKPKGKPHKDPENLLEKTMNSGHQVFLAGIGALVKATEEGPKLFKSLVEGGAARATHTETKAEQNNTESFASEDNPLEQRLEERIDRVLNRSGIPTNKDIQELFKQMEALRKSVNELIAAKTAMADAQDHHATATPSSNEPEDQVPKGGSKP